MTDFCLPFDTALKCHHSTDDPEKSTLRRVDCLQRSFPTAKDAQDSKKHKRQTALSNPPKSSTSTTHKKLTTSLKDQWGKWTNDLVQLSTFPFLFLSIPQLLQNAVNLSNGKLTALSILSWKGFMTALVGNSILMSYFFKKRENGAAVVQAIGVISNFILLVQISMAGLLTGGILFSVGIFILLCSFVNGMIVLGVSRSWEWIRIDIINLLWETLLSVLGLSLLAHVVWSTINPKTTLFPAFATAVISLTVGILHWRNALCPSVEKVWNGISAWTATFLFAFQPIGQLVCNFKDPSSLAGLSLNTILLAMAGNALMIPRALRTRDTIWLTGTLWSVVMMGWAQLLCLYIGGLHTGLCHLSTTFFYFLSSCVVLYFLSVFSIEDSDST